jgi:hypothetical protein
MGEACGMHARKENATGTSLGSFKVKYTYEYLGVNGIMILKLM